MDAFEREQPPPARPWLRDLGFPTGVLPTGAANNISDVPGVLVGHHTLIRGQDIRTGVTAILPHGENLYQNRLPAGLYIANGFGKMTGVSQLTELGEIETPILLTNTLSVPAAAQAIISWTLSQPGNSKVVSVNPVVGETNDSQLNDIRRQSITPEMALNAIKCAAAAPTAEGVIGAGTGVTAFGWKSGIGSSSRQVDAALGTCTLGVLAQVNIGGDLHILGKPIGRHLPSGRTLPNDEPEAHQGGSIMIVVATDAPLSDRNLTRLAHRAFAGVARTGASFSNSSGDYALAFSTAESVRRTAGRPLQPGPFLEIPNQQMDALFLAVAEAVEEAVYNSLFCAQTVSGFKGTTYRAIPHEMVLPLLQAARRG